MGAVTLLTKQCRPPKESPNLFGKTKALMRRTPSTAPMTTKLPTQVLSPRTIHVKRKKNPKSKKSSKAGPASKKHKKSAKSSSEDDDDSSDDEDDKKKSKSKKSDRKSEKVAKKKVKHEFPAQGTIVSDT